MLPIVHYSFYEIVFIYHNMNYTRWPLNSIFYITFLLILLCIHDKWEQSYLITLFLKNDRWVFLIKKERSKKPSVCSSEKSDQNTIVPDHSPHQHLKIYYFKEWCVKTSHNSLKYVNVVILGHLKREKKFLSLPIVLLKD